MSKSRKLATNVHVDGHVYGPDSDVPADVAKQITNPKAWADGTAGSDDDGAFDVEKANKAQLEAEIARRNEGRDEADQIVAQAPGNKAELQAAVKADDAKS